MTSPAYTAACDQAEAAAAHEDLRRRESHVDTGPVSGWLKELVDLSEELLTGRGGYGFEIRLCQHLLVDPSLPATVHTVANNLLVCAACRPVLVAQFPACCFRCKSLSVPVVMVMVPLTPRVLFGEGRWSAAGPIVLEVNGCFPCFKDADTDGNGAR